MKISKRISDMQFSPIRKLAPYGEASTLKGLEVYHLNIGQPNIATPNTFFEGLKASMKPF